MLDKKGGDDSSRPSSSFVNSGDRKIFTVELRPEETTIVSWKKFMKDANKVSGLHAPVPEPPVDAHTSLESRIAPVREQSYIFFFAYCTLCSSRFGISFFVIFRFD